jgi:hypothetical protein
LQELEKMDKETSAAEYSQKEKEELFERLTDVVHVPLTKETRENLYAIFNEDFMETYTNCGNFNEFMFSSAVFVNWDDDVLVYSKKQFDDFVAETTRFGSWEEMMNKGAEDYRSRTQ